MEKLAASMRKPPPTPGEILVEDVLKPMGISQTDFAKRIGVAFPRLNEVVNGTARRIDRYSFALCQGARNGR